MITEIQAEQNWKNTASVTIDNYDHDKFKKFNAPIYKAIIKSIRSVTI